MTERNDDMRDAGEARDAAIEARYRAASNEMPSAAADAAILAQARAAAVQMNHVTPLAQPAPLAQVPQVPAPTPQAANDASWSKRLRAPLALAACAVLTVGIVTRIGVENPTGVTASAPVSERIERPTETASSASTPLPPLAPAIASSTTAQAPGAPAPAGAPDARAKASSMGKAADAAAAANGPALAGAAQPTTVQPPAEAERKLRDDARKPSAQMAGAPPVEAERSLSVTGVREPAASAVKESPATAPAPAAVADAAPFAAAAPMAAAKPAARALQGMTSSAEAANAGAGSAAAGAMSKRETLALLSISREAELSPERWLAYVIELRRAGQHAAADASLARLQVRYPEQSIPANARGPQAFPDGSK